MSYKVEVLIHSAIRFSGEKTIYIDPFKLSKEEHDADLIFITHSHYDHFSEEDILKIKKERTKIIIPKDLEERVQQLDFSKEDILIVEPNKKYHFDEMMIETVPAYNVNKSFHPKENAWVGYLLTLDQIVYYIAGDTDITSENQQVKCDVALVPVGGTYTMTAKEAAQLINKIKPSIAIPIHYGSIVGTKEDAKEFTKLLLPTIDGKILL